MISRTFWLNITFSKSKNRNLATLPFQAVSSVSADSVNAPEFVPRFAVGTCLQLDIIVEKDS